MDDRTEIRYFNDTKVDNNNNNFINTFMALHSKIDLLVKLKIENYMYRAVTFKIFIYFSNKKSTTLYY